MYVLLIVVLLWYGIDWDKYTQRAYTQQELRRVRAIRAAYCGRQCGL